MSAYFYDGLDRLSFSLGMIEAFCEIVAGGIKPLALSPPIDADMHPKLAPYSEKIAAKYRLATYTEVDFPPTDMLPESETAGKIVIFYFADERLKRDYLLLRSEIADLIDRGSYGSAEKSEMTVRFRKLLGYPV